MSNPFCVYEADSDGRSQRWRRTVKWRRRESKERLRRQKYLRNRRLHLSLQSCLHYVCTVVTSGVTCWQPMTLCWSTSSSFGRVWDNLREKPSTRWFLKQREISHKEVSSSVWVEFLLSLNRFEWLLGASPIQKCRAKASTIAELNFK